MTDHLKNISDFVTVLQSKLPLIKEEYSVASSGLFGPYVRNNQNLKSDLDILVEFNETPSILQYIDLENYLRADES